MCVSPQLRGFSLKHLVSVETMFPAGSHPLSTSPSDTAVRGAGSWGLPAQITVSPKFTSSEKFKLKEKPEELLSVKRTRV